MSDNVKLCPDVIVEVQGIEPNVDNEPVGWRWPIYDEGTFRFELQISERVHTDEAQDAPSYLLGGTSVGRKQFAMALEMAKLKQLRRIADALEQKPNERIQRLLTKAAGLSPGINWGPVIGVRQEARAILGLPEEPDHPED